MTQGNTGEKHKANYANTSPGNKIKARRQGNGVR